MKIFAFEFFRENINRKKIKFLYKELAFYSNIDDLFYIIFKVERIILLFILSDIMAYLYMTLKIFQITTPENELDNIFLNLTMKILLIKYQDLNFDDFKDIIKTIETKE